MKTNKKSKKWKVLSEKQIEQMARAIIDEAEINLRAGVQNVKRVLPAPQVIEQIF